MNQVTVFLKENVMQIGHVKVPMRSAMFLNMTTVNTVMWRHIPQNASLAVNLMTIVHLVNIVLVICKFFRLFILMSIT